MASHLSFLIRDQAIDLGTVTSAFPGGVKHFSRYGEGGAKHFSRLDEGGAKLFSSYVEGAKNLKSKRYHSFMYYFVLNIKSGFTKK